MKKYLLSLTVLFSLHVSVYALNNNAPMVPIISYLLSDSTPVKANAFSNIVVDTLPAGDTRTIQVYAGENARYSLKNAPAFMSINSQNGLMQFNAPVDNTQLYAFNVLANIDGKVKSSNRIKGKVKVINETLAHDLGRYNVIQKEAYNTNANLRDVRTSSELYMVPNDMNDINSTWDILQVYYENYKRNIEIVIIDGDTGAIKKEYADGGAWNGMKHVISKEGKLYMISAKADGTMKPQINIYDPHTNSLSKDAITLPDDIRGNTYNGVEIATDGAMFIYASHKSDDGNNYKPRILEINSQNNTVVSDSGPISTPAQVWKIAADEKYVYLLTGKVPWGVIQYERTAPHHVKILASGDSVNIMQSAYGVVLEIGASGGEHSFLYEDAIYPADDPDDWRSTIPPWPYPDTFSDRDIWGSLVIRTNIVDRNLPNKPTIVQDNAEPINSQAELWIKQPLELEEKKYAYHVNDYPIIINRILKRSDGKIFAGAGGYGSYFTYNPVDNSFERSAGSLNVSLYTMIEYDKKIYLSGYPRGVLFEYDYSKPWTQGIHNYAPGVESLSYRDQSLNPRWCGKLAEHGSGAHKIYTSAIGEDGVLYFGGQWMRDGNGGGLAWYDTKTKEMGGISEPFVNYAIQHIISMDDGKYIAISTVAVTSQDGFKPSSAKLFIFNTQTKQIEKVLDPMGDVEGKMTGQIIEADKDYIVGLAADPTTYSNTYIYRINIKTGHLDYKLLLEGSGFEANFAVGTTIEKNSKGKIITWLGWALVEIDAISGDIKVLFQYNYESRQGVLGDAVLDGDNVYLGRFNSLLRLEDIYSNAK